MDRERVAAACRSLTGVTEGYPFGEEALVFKVGGKMFAVVVEESVSLKCDPGLAVALRQEYPAVTAGYHLNKRHWNTIELDASVPDEDIEDWIQDSYDLVVASLPRAVRASLRARADRTSGDALG